MGSKKKISTATATMKNLRKKSSHAIRRLSNPEGAVCHRGAGSICDGESVSDKLEALRNLISSENEEINPDQLFQETADYIVLLKTQVLVLQKLIGFYEPQRPKENQNSV